jgi:hypothetical protein
MAKIPKIKKHQKESFIKQTLAAKSSVDFLDEDECFKISLRHLDKIQGQTLSEWQDAFILADAVETLGNLCHRPLKSQQSSTFTIYGNFPPRDKTEFFHPIHVPEDAEWARIHVKGKTCLIGHVVKNTFYLVFLDAEHRFWISELRNT